MEPGKEVTLDPVNTMLLLIAYGSISPELLGHCPEVMVKIEDVEYTSVLDSRTQVTIILQSFCKRD